MKIIVTVALFAFVAVQMCQAAPRPDDDKKEEATATAVPPVPLAAEVNNATMTGLEVKSESANSEAASTIDVSVAPPEEKKE